VTIADVALLARVSKTTVSHVLSGNRPVAVGTRERVEDAVRKLGYRPHGVARSLRTKTSHMVALIIPDITNPFYPVVARGLEDGLGGGYRALICNTDRHPEREIEFLQETADRGVDGIVLDSYTLSSERIIDLVSQGVAVVRMGRSLPEDDGMDTAHGDDKRGAYDATAHLLRVSGPIPAMIQGPPGAGTDRNAGYLEAVRAAAVPVRPELVVSGGWTRQGGASAMRRLLTLADPPTAVFCANDLMALGALDAARELGVAVPRDVAIAGFDDIEAAALSVPALTTVTNPAYETGFLAGHMLRDRMTGRYAGPPRAVTLPCRLVRRATA
jgi:LacI family transcriptional regulator, galactose operon repressor